MEQNFKQINLEKPYRVRKRKLPKKIKTTLVVVGVLLFLSFIYSSFRSTTSVFQYVIPNVLSQNPLKQSNDRVNILLLGNAGGSHDGAELTDSIIIASYHLKSHRLTLISIPRDLWLDSIKQKINAAYEYGELAKNGGDGLKFAEEKIDDVLGFPIHYGVRINFDGFAKAIDLIGGVDIEVPRTFDDYNYPITGKENDLCGLSEKEVELKEEEAKKYNLSPGKQKVFVGKDDQIATDSGMFDCRLEHIHYDRGLNHMNGEEALKFVRSRKGTNGEGSDFARSRRQQLVIQAFRSKALSLETLINPQKVAGLLQTFGKSVETDIPKEHYFELYNLSKKIEGVNSLVLGDLGIGQSILINPPTADYGGAYVLVPANNDFKVVQTFLKSELDKQATASSKTK